MSSHILVDSEHLDALAARLCRLDAELDSIGSQLKSLHVDRGAGGNIACGVSLRLRGVDMRIGSTDVAGVIRQFATGVSKVSDQASALAKAAAMASTMFSETERDLVRRIEAMDAGSDFAQQASAQKTEGGVDFQQLDRALSRFFGMIKKSAVNPAELTNFFKSLGLEDVFFPGIVSSMAGLTLLPFESDRVSVFGGGTSVQKGGVTHTEETYFLWAKNDSKAGLNASSWKPSKLQIKMPELKDPSKEKKDDKKKDPNGYRDKMTLMEWGATLGGSVGLFQTGFEEAGDGYSYGAEAGVFTGEAHGGIKGGFYSYKVGPDGKTHRTFSPGAEVYAGVSATALEASLSGEYELIDNVAIGGEVDVEVLSGEASANAGVGFVDGKFMLNAEAKAEADLAKIEGEAYVDAFGIKGTIGGELKVGVGAHAKVGWRDGKLSMDVGAALGVGASVKFELDVGGMVDNVVDNVKQGFESFGDAISKGVSGIFSLF